MENLCCNKMSSFTNSSNSKLDSKLDSTKFATLKKQVSRSEETMKVECAYNFGKCADAV